MPSYRSAFDGYRTWSAGDVEGSWRRANEEMGRLEGHAGHLGNAEGGEPSEAPAASDAAQGSKHGAHAHGDHEK